MGIVAKNGGGLQEGEVALPDESVLHTTQDNEPFVPDEMLVATLASFGFAEDACTAAAKAVNNSGVEEAMEWILQNSDETGFNPPCATPVEQTDGTEYDESSVLMIMEMTGATKGQVTKALNAVGGDMDNAVNWLFSQDNLDEVESTQPSMSEQTEKVRLQRSANGSYNGLYSLVGIVSHIGSTTNSGHYVAHKRIDKFGNPLICNDQSVEWVFFNDEKVALSQDPPIDAGYLYLYRRRD